MYLKSSKNLQKTHTFFCKVLLNCGFEKARENMSSRFCVMFGVFHFFHVLEIMSGLALAIRLAVGTGMQDESPRAAFH